MNTNSTDRISPADATRIRVFREGRESWAIDAAGPQDDQYTEACWNRDGAPDAKLTRQRAIELVPEFVAYAGLPAGLPVEVEQTDRAAFTLRDNSGDPRHLDRRLKVTANAAGGDYVFLEVEGYGPSDCHGPIALETWRGRLRLLVWNRGPDADPMIIDLEHLRAFGLAETVGRSQGWDIFATGGGTYAVQAEDAGLLEPDALNINDADAVKLAREAGVECDDDGVIMGLHPDSAA